jgi:thioredoxin reductase
MTNSLRHDPEVYDITIIGAGPTGLFTAFYAGLRRSSVKLIESMPQLGGQLSALYPEKYIYDVAGFPKILAQQLVNNLKEQITRFSPKVCLDEKVLNVTKKEDNTFLIETNLGKHLSKSIIISAGVGAFEPRRLELPEAAQFEGKNLHYFVEDLSAFKDQKVLISGGGDSALDWALMLEPIAEKVTLVHRRDKFRAHEHSVELLIKSKVDVITPQEIIRLEGTKDHIERALLQHIKTKEEAVIDVDAVIINFGFVSSLGPIQEWGLEIESGSIVVNSRMETNVPGIYAAGDICTYPGKVKLIAVGFGEAPTAVNNAKMYIDPNAKLHPGHSSNMF